MKEKKDIMKWAPIGLGVIALTLASISFFVSSRTRAYQEDIYRDMEGRSYVRAVEELEEMMREIGVEYPKKPSTLTEVLVPLMQPMEEVE